eukprot:s896_g7.t1
MLRLFAVLLCLSLARTAPIDVDSHMSSWLFGPDRNLSEAAKYMALGAEKGCGRCFFYLGAMLALGEPETNVSARFKVLSDGNIEFRWARGLARAEGLPASTSILDRPAIAYYVGAQKGDPLAVLAFSYYVLNRLTLGSPGAAWWIAGERPQAAHGLRRKPWREEATPALCQLILRTLENVAETAARNEDGATDASDLHFFVQNASEVQRAKKEHADWIRARSKDGYKEAEVVEAAYLFHGDADLNLTRNVSRALELFDAAASTTTEAAWNSMLLHAREGRESKIIQHAQNIIQDPEATPLQKTMAQHYLHRFGADDTRPNSTRAGVYLLAAAELGDSNAQQMIAHAYAGLELPELDNVKIPGAPNTKRAMHFYMKAAKQGRPVSAVNAVSLMLRNPEGQRSTADDRCRGAVETLRDVALAYHPEVLQLHGRARHAFDSGDEEGALISFALLSCSDPLWLKLSICFDTIELAKLEGSQSDPLSASQTPDLIMAATIVIVANEKRRKSRRKSQLKGESGTMDLDADNDGNISPEELMLDFGGIHMRADIMLERMKLEDGLLGFIQQMPLFLLCLICFLVAISILSPAEETSAIHQHLESHFGLGDVGNIKDVAGIYDFVTAFEKKNLEMMPTSPDYWCEHRYYQYAWDDHYQIPTSTCNSPRYTALGLQSAPVWTNGSVTASSGGHRRLAGSHTDTDGPTATHDNPPCEDNDTAYALEEDKPNITCEEDASHACGIDLGILLCPKTCGYCAPFEYESLKRFGKPQLTLLPSVLFQTRLEETACHGFAANVQVQNYNPLLSLLPALDGKKKGNILKCIDRNKQQTSEYALYLDCPDHTPSHRCVDGKVGIGTKQSFHGETVYAEMLIESSKLLTGMQKVGWIDIQTDRVSISTMVYTEGLEMFTSLTVEFSFDEAGNVEGAVHMITYRDLTRDAASDFAGCLITTCVGAFISIVSLVGFLCCHPERYNLGLMLYEIISRLVLFIYPLILLISWTQQELMSHEYDLLMQAFMHNEGMDAEHVKHSVAEYFKVKTVIYEEADWLERHRIAAYIVLYVQFLQMVLAFNVHPRVAMLTSTIQKALHNMMHFFFVFAILFLMLAFMANFLLGGRIHVFGTFGEACSAQVRMLFGEFIYADGVEVLSGTALVMYWLYAVSFMLIVFFTLLNFFLAIIVDAFVDVKNSTGELRVTQSFFSDLCLMPWSAYLHRKYKLPPRKKLVTYFTEALKTYNSAEKGAENSGGFPLLSARALVEEFGVEEAPVCQWLCHIEKISTVPLIHYHGEEGVASRDLVESRELAELGENKDEPEEADANPDQRSEPLCAQELGANNAHTNAASLWKKGQKKTLKCWRSTSTDPTGRLCELDYRRRAALTGNVDAMLRLASLHENLGEENQAQHWIRKAGDAGSIQAKHSIAYSQANSPSSEDRSSACMEYCKLLKLQDEPVLARGSRWA